VRASDLPVAAQYTWTFTVLESGPDTPHADVRDEVRVQYSELLEELRVTAGERSWRVEAADDAEVRLLLGRGLPYVAWITSRQGSTFTVQVHVFPVSYRLPDRFALGVDDAVVDRMRTLTGVKITSERAVELLSEDLSIPALPGGLPRFLYVGSPNRHPNSESFLRLLGRRYNADVAFQDGQWLVVFVTMIKNKRVTNRPVTLLEADWTFTNVTLAAGSGSSTRRWSAAAVSTSPGSSARCPTPSGPSSARASGRSRRPSRRSSWPPCGSSRASRCAPQRSGPSTWIRMWRPRPRRGAAHLRNSPGSSPGSRAARYGSGPSVVTRASRRRQAGCP
jgi:hypothetical protein